MLQRAAIQKNLWKLWLDINGGDPADAVQAGPGPEPWKVGLEKKLVQLAAIKVNLKAVGRGTEQIQRSMEEVVDFVCGTPWPHPWPWPPQNAWEIIAEVSLVAHSLQPGELKTELNELTKSMTLKSMHAPENVTSR